MDKVMNVIIRELNEMIVGIKNIRTLQAEKYWIDQIRRTDLLEGIRDILVEYKLSYKLSRQWSKKNKLQKIISVLKGLDKEFFIEQE